jgi:hypothetical protein
MSSHSLVVLFQALALVGTGLTVYKLLSTQLHRRYQAFFWYFIFRIFNGLPGLFLDQKSALYFYCWFFGSPIVWIFYVLVVRELYGLVLARHPGMYTLGRWLIYSGIFLSVTLSIVSFLPHLPRATAQRSQWTALKSSSVGYMLSIHRGMTFGLAVFLVLMVFLLSLYAVSLSRNVKIHSTLFAVFFLTSSIGAVLQSVFGLRLYVAVDTGLMAVSSVLTFAWFFLLSPAGEKLPIRQEPIDLKDESRILYHLDALNATLVKVGRK